MVKREWPSAAVSLRSRRQTAELDWNGRTVHAACDPKIIMVHDRSGNLIQRLEVDSGTGAVTFSCGDGPLFGLGEGNHQFDRRGAVYPMEHGQGGPEFPQLGGRMPVPWLASPAGWAIFWHRPLGSFDLTGEIGRLKPRGADARLPLDIFVMVGRPPELYAGLAALTGAPHMPPRWALGYLQ